MAMKKQRNTTSKRRKEKLKGRQDSKMIDKEAMEAVGTTEPVEAFRSIPNIKAMEDIINIMNSQLRKTKKEMLRL